MADDVVFGSNVVINCADDEDQLPVVLEEALLITGVKVKGLLVVVQEGRTDQGQGWG